MENDNVFFEQYLQYYAEYKKTGKLPERPIKPATEVSPDEALLNKVKAKYDRLMNKLDAEIETAGDYVWPEADDACVYFFLPKNVQTDAIFNALCQYAGSKSEHWSAEQLTDFLVANLRQGRLPCSFGGFEPVCVAIAMATVLGKLNEAKVIFLHDKWESRGDAGYDEYNSHVKIRCKKHAAVIFTDYSKDYDSDSDEEDEDDDYDYDCEENGNAVKSLKNEPSAFDAFLRDFAQRTYDVNQWMNHYQNDLTVRPQIIIAGKKFAFTGFGHSDEGDHCVVKAVIARGGLHRGSVSGLTDYLVVNPRFAGDSKLQKAIEQKENGKGIQIILINDLMDCLANAAPSSAPVAPRPTAAECTTVSIPAKTTDTVPAETDTGSSKTTGGSTAGTAADSNHNTASSSTVKLPTLKLIGNEDRQSETIYKMNDCAWPPVFIRFSCVEIDFDHVSLAGNTIALGCELSKDEQEKLEENNITVARTISSDVDYIIVNSWEGAKHYSIYLYEHKYELQLQAKVMFRESFVALLDDEGEKPIWGRDFTYADVLQNDDYYRCSTPTTSKDCLNVPKMQIDYLETDIKHAGIKNKIIDGWDMFESFVDPFRNKFVPYLQKYATYTEEYTENADYILVWRIVDAVQMTNRVFQYRFSYPKAKILMAGDLLQLIEDEKNHRRTVQSTPNFTVTQAEEITKRSTIDGAMFLNENAPGNTDAGNRQVASDKSTITAVNDVVSINPAWRSFDAVKNKLTLVISQNGDSVVPRSDASKSYQIVCTGTALVSVCIKKDGEVSLGRYCLVTNNACAYWGTTVRDVWEFAAQNGYYDARQCKVNAYTVINECMSSIRSFYLETKVFSLPKSIPTVDVMKTMVNPTSTYTDPFQNKTGNKSSTTAAKSSNSSNSSKSSGSSNTSNAPVSQKKEGCYIATAVYGSYDAPEVLVLRQYRDTVLKKTVLGRGFIAFYYRVSPFFAEKLKKASRVNAWVRNKLDKWVVKLIDKYNWS